MKHLDAQGLISALSLWRRFPYLIPDLNDALVSDIRQWLGHDDPNVAAVAAELLGHLGAAELRGRLAKIAKSGPGIAAIGALRAIMLLARHHDSRSAKIIYSFLESDDSHLTMRTLQMIERARLPIPRKYFIRLCHDREPRVRILALRALGNMKRGGLAILRHMARHDSSELVRVEAMCSLASRDGSVQLDWEALLDPSRGDDVVRCALAYLARRKSSGEHVKTLKRVLKRRNPAVQVLALEALWKQGRGECGRFFRRVAASSEYSAEVRECARALAELPESRRHV